MAIRVCFVNSEISAYGGFGRQNRIIGRELIKRGIEVYVLVPQVEGQRRIEQIEGMTVLTFPHQSIKMLLTQGFFRLPEADIYELHNPYPLFYHFVTRAISKTKSKIVIMFADPVSREDIKAMISTDPKLKNLRNRNNLKVPFFAYYLYLMYLRPYLVQRTISKGDAYFCEAKYLISKVKGMHNLKTEPIFMPHVVEIPIEKPLKSPQPTVCFLGRWDPVKRVERFFELARRFPKVQFITIGGSPGRDEKLREMGFGIPQLEILGRVSEERKREILQKSWILVNTSIREGLPQSFIEACSYRCAIVSAVNPDNYATNFGYHVQNDDFESGLEYLLEDNRWKEKGEAGFEYVKETNDINKVIERRIEVYKSLLRKR